MNQLFNYEGNEVRTVIVEGEPWFVAKDVCNVLGLGNVGQATVRLDSDEKADVILNDGSQGRLQLAISESGLYSLILGSRKPEARKFKRWVTSEVLPTIRKTGMYATDALLDDPELLLKTVTRLRDERQLRLAAELKLTEQAPKVAAYETLIEADGTQSMGEVAKALGFGRNTMFAKLRALKVLTRENTPYQRYINSGYFDVFETVRSGKAFTVTRVTPKGIGFIYEKVGA